MPDVAVIAANLRLPLSRDRGRLRWPVRRIRAVKRLRGRNPDVLLAVECDEQQTPYIARKLGMVAVKPTPGNRVVFYRPEWGECVATLSTDLGERSFAVAAKLRAGVSESWFVAVHLAAADSRLRGRQLAALNGWLSAEVTGPAVVGGDFNTTAPMLSGFRDARREVVSVINGAADSLHGWGVQRHNGRWIDHLLVRGVSVRWVELVLTSAGDESDHNWPSAGLTVPAIGDPA